LHSGAASRTWRELLIFEECHFVRKAVLLVANLVNAAGRNLLSRKIETHWHGSPPFSDSAPEQVCCVTEWLLDLMPFGDDGVVAHLGICVENRE
jgi:hypothetical protein